MQPFLQAYNIMNTSCYLGSQVITLRLLGVEAVAVFFNGGAGEVLDARVDCHHFVYIQVDWNFTFHVSLEGGPVNGPEVRVIRWL
jgi:hypothetical protein